MTEANTGKLDQPTTPNDQILPPVAWEGIPLKTMIQQLCNQPVQDGTDMTTAVPPTYSRIKSWEQASILQKQKNLTAWENLNEEVHCKMIADGINKHKLSKSDVDGGGHWNTNEWARLIHLFKDPKLSSLWTRTVTVRNLLHLFCHTIINGI